MGMPAKSADFTEDGPVALLPFLFGPATVGLVCLGLLYGKKGLREFRKRLFRWNIGFRWYAFSLLTLPVMLSLQLFVLSRFSHAFLPKVLNEPDKPSFILTGLLLGFIGGGILEETGWTGFATPELRKRYGVFKSGLVLGLIWAVWHFLPVYWGSGNTDGIIDWSLFLPGLFCHYTVLVSYRIIMVWVHEKTGSMIPVILMHGVLGAFANFILNISVGGLPLFLYYLTLAVALWIVVAVLFVNRKEKQ